MSFSSCKVNDIIMFFIEDNFSLKVVVQRLDIYLNEKKKSMIFLCLGENFTFIHKSSFIVPSPSRHVKSCFQNPK